MQLKSRLSFYKIIIAKIILSLSTIESKNTKFHSYLLKLYIYICKCILGSLYFRNIITYKLIQLQKMKTLNNINNRIEEHEIPFLSS